MRKWQYPNTSSPIKLTYLTPPKENVYFNTTRGAYNTIIMLSSYFSHWLVHCSQQQQLKLS